MEELMNREEHEEAAEQHRQRLREEKGKPPEERNFPEERLGTHCKATCHGSGCPNKGKAFPAYVTENADAMYRVYCGRCNSKIDDVVPEYDDGPGPKLPTRLEETEQHVKPVRDRVEVRRREERKK